MNSRLSMTGSASGYSPVEPRRTSDPTGQNEVSLMRQHMGQRIVYGDPHSFHQASPSASTTAGSSPDRIPSGYAPYTQQTQLRSGGERFEQSFGGYDDLNRWSSWQEHPAYSSPLGQDRGPAASSFGMRPGSSSFLSAARPTSLLRRRSSDDAPLNPYAQHYYGADISSSMPSLPPRSHPQRRPSNRDEFDGPSQYLDKPEDCGYEPTEDELPKLPISLHAQEQDRILSQVNDRLSLCAFEFVAKYQFPIPVEPDKRPVRVPNDREWSEWVYLLKRLATKRRIPARVLYNGQIKQLITILENSLEMRHAAKHQSRPLKDDRNILQLISSGLQVAKILKDAPAMQFLDNLYSQAERTIQERRGMASRQFRE